MVETNVTSVQGFISYTRQDNADFASVVDRLKTEIEGRFHAATGRRLELFLDREAIGWGADWRSEIRGSVKSATFFIPIVTMRYFDSAPCREELIAFYENANQLGVTELILPLVLAGSDAISDKDPRPEVKLIESLNYKNIEDAWLSGYESSAWLRSVHEMVNGLKKNLLDAEAALAAQETEVGAAAFRKSEAKEPIEAESEADISALGEDLAEVTHLVKESAQTITGFGAAASESMQGVDLAGLAPKQQQVALIRVAMALKAPAEELAATGNRLERRISGTDARLRAVIDELRTIDADLAQTQLDTLVAALTGIDQLSKVVEQMDGLVEVLRFAALSNVSLRKSVQPAIQGLQSISNAVATFESWRTI